ncbi:MAG: repeat protein [Acidobacteriales bacterium]|nr:repeat protein [Terriglobales bacterium]
MPRYFKHFATFLFLLLLTGTTLEGQIVSAQSANRIVNMQITLAFDDGSNFSGSISTGQNQPAAGHERDTTAGQPSSDVAANLQIHVQLQDSFGANLDEKSPNGEGQVLFTVRNGGSYRIRVRGPDIEETVLDNVEPALGDRMLNIRLHRKGAKGSLATTGSGVVAAKRLKAPPAAVKEVEKGDKALAAGDLPKARQSFEKAIEIYPDYDIPYNNLGVILMQTGDAEGGRRAFEKAIQLNENFTRAYTNLARIELSGQHYSEADKAVVKALVNEPLNAQALCLGVQAAYLSGRLDGAVSYAKTLHTISHKECAIGHYFAARALIGNKLPDQAIEELEMFLKEAPTDTNAPDAQLKLEQLKHRQP